MKFLKILLAVFLAFSAGVQAQSPTNGDGTYTIPIYHAKEYGTTHVLHIYASLNGGVLAPYLVDSGSPNFFSTYAQSWWPGSPTHVVSGNNTLSFASGNQFNYNPITASVQLGDRNGKAIVSIPQAQVAILGNATVNGTTSDYHQWKDITATTSKGLTENPALPNGTFGNFGLGIEGNRNVPGTGAPGAPQYPLSTILAQLPLGSSVDAGFIVNTGGKIDAPATLTIGISPQVRALLKSSLAVQLTMGTSNSTISGPNSSSLPGYYQAQAQGTAVKVKATSEAEGSSPLPTIFDTGGGDGSYIMAGENPSLPTGPLDKIEVSSNGTKFLEYKDGQTNLGGPLSSSQSSNYNPEKAQGPRTNTGLAAFYKFIVAFDLTMGEVYLLPFTAVESLPLLHNALTPVTANFTVSSNTITENGSSVIVNSLTMLAGSKLTVGGNLSITTGGLMAPSGSSVVLNGQVSANSLTINPGATLSGNGTILAPIVVSGTLSPGNSPGTLTMSSLALTSSAVTNIEIASLSNFDRIVVGGTANLGGTLAIMPYGGNPLAYGQQFSFLQAEAISGDFTAITAPEAFRGRFLNLGTNGVILIAPDTYTRVAVTPNQREAANALDSFIPATRGDRLAVSTALDLQTAAQYPYAFEQIAPGFYESLANIAIEQTYNQSQLLTQRLGSLRLGAIGFQAIGITQPLKYDKNGASASDAKTQSPIVESALDTNWNSWVLADGEFSLSRGLSGVPNYNNNAGGFLAGADYRLSRNFAAGLFAGYQYSFAKYNGGSSSEGNSALFGLYGSYTHEDGYYADAIVGGGYTGFQTRRSIQFSTIDRTASANPNSGQFSAALNLGKDFELGKFTIGPIAGAQYTYAGIGGFTESGADSLDLALGQQNANSLRSNLGARLAYEWAVSKSLTFIPEVRGFWMHEFLNNPRNINSSLDGGNGPSFGYETTSPYRNSAFGGVGLSARIGDRWSASAFYNVNFGASGYTNNFISTSLNFAF